MSHILSPKPRQGQTVPAAAAGDVAFSALSSSSLAPSEHGPIVIPSASSGAAQFPIVTLPSSSSLDTVGMTAASPAAPPQSSSVLTLPISPSPGTQQQQQQRQSSGWFGGLLRSPSPSPGASASPKPSGSPPPCVIDNSTHAAFHLVIAPAQHKAHQQLRQSALLDGVLASPQCRSSSPDNSLPSPSSNNGGGAAVEGVCETVLQPVDPNDPDAVTGCGVQSSLHPHDFQFDRKDTWYLKYFLCVALSLVIGAVQVLLPLEAAPSTPEDPEAQISFASYVLVHQGFYALGAGFFEACIFEACLPAKGIKTHLATAANLLGAIAITWSVYAFAHAVDRHSIQHSLIHTIGPLVLVIPVMLRYLWRAKCLHDREVRAYNRRTNSLKLRTDTAAVSAVAAALVGSGERVGASPEPLLGDQQDYNDSSFTAGAASFKQHVSPPPKSAQSSFGGVFHSVAPSFYPVPPSPFWRSDVFLHWLSSVGIHVILLHVFFFCQWATLTFKKVVDSSILQFGVLLLFQGVMFLAKVTLKFLTERMDFRPLPSLTRAEARIRPKLTCMGDALMQLFFFNFYRTLFTSIERVETFAIMMLLHVLTELCVYPLRMWAPVHTRHQAFLRHVESCLPMRVRASVLGQWLRRSLTLEEQQVSLCVEYVCRSLAFFLSLLSFIFYSCWLQFGRGNPHYINASLYDPFDANTAALVLSMQYLCVAFAVEVVCFAAVIVLARREIRFPFFAPWARLMHHKLPMMLFIAGASHIIHDVAQARFLPNTISSA